MRHDEKNFRIGGIDVHCAASLSTRGRSRRSVFQDLHDDSGRRLAEEFGRNIASAHQVSRCSYRLSNSFRTVIRTGIINSSIPDLNDVANEIARLSPSQSRTNGLTQAATQSNTASRTVSASQADLSALQSQIQMLQQQLQQSQMEKALLEAKLKESLSAQPASADPHEFAKAQEQIRALQKENELLKVNLDRPQATATPPVDSRSLDKLKSDLAEANQKLTQQTDLATKLARENKLCSRV